MNIRKKVPRESGANLASTGEVDLLEEEADEGNLVRELRELVIRALSQYLRHVRNKTLV